MTQAKAEQLSRERAQRRRYVSVEVEVNEYVTVDVPMGKISTAELIDELRQRNRNGDPAAERSDGEMDDDEAVYTLHPSELYAIRHLFLIGREVEAADRCRRLIADMLGTAI